MSGEQLSMFDSAPKLEPVKFVEFTPAPKPQVTHRAIRLLAMYPDQFTDEFRGYLPDNLHVLDAFEREALRVLERGHKHYSARTIVEVLRHHSALQEKSGQWKLNDHNTPYLARMFALLHPVHAKLFEFRGAKAAKRDNAVARST